MSDSPCLEGNEMIAAHIADLAYKAMLAEAGASPKPGLVCPDHSGAHTDMDYPLFVVSAKSLRPYLAECGTVGGELCEATPEDVFPLLRNAGVHAEKNMFKATNGVNTHKGMIFSMGLATAAATRLLGKGFRPVPEAVAKEAALFVSGIVARDLGPLKRELPERPLTAGEKLFLEHGIAGIRQEAEDGFPHAVKAFHRLLSLKVEMTLEKALPHVLLWIIAETQDTNILWRGGVDGLNYARSAAMEAINKGGMRTREGHEHILRIRDEFFRRNLSPGGSADLLALATFFLSLHELEESGICI